MIDFWENLKKVYKMFANVRFEGGNMIAMKSVIDLVTFSSHNNVLLSLHESRLN